MKWTNWIKGWCKNKNKTWQYKNTSTHSKPNRLSYNMSLNCQAVECEVINWSNNKQGSKASKSFAPLLQELMATFWRCSGGFYFIYNEWLWHLSTIHLSHFACWPDVFMVRGTWQDCCHVQLKLGGRNEAKQRHTVKQYWTAMVKYFIRSHSRGTISHI